MTVQRFLLFVDHISTWAGKWQYDQNVDYRIAFNHYFGKKT